MTALEGGYKTPHEDRSYTLIRGNNACSTTVVDIPSMHGHRNKRSMSLTCNGDDYTHLTTLRSNRRAEEENLESPKEIFPLLKYEKQEPILASTGQSAYFVCISIGADNNNMHTITCHLDTKAQPSPISKTIMPTD